MAKQPVYVDLFPGTVVVKESTRSDTRLHCVECDIDHEGHSVLFDTEHGLVCALHFTILIDHGGNVE